MTVLVIFTLGLPFWMPVSADLAESGESLSSQYITLAIQGDLRDAASLFATAGALTETDLELKRKFEARFQLPARVNANEIRGDKLTADLVAAYQDYWRNGLVGNGAQEDYEKQLFADLLSIEHSRGGSTGNTSGADGHFPGEMLDQVGFHYLDTNTPPYRDLFIWRKQRTARYRVELTDTRTPVIVNFMDDFLIQGWKEYASLGLATTTGWVENAQLYCVAWAYDTGSENFEVSYLKHEARHLVDLEKYPDMQPIELEYRAKLTELAYAHTSLKRILDDFRAKAANNSKSAHAMANWMVTRDLYHRLEGQKIPENWTGWGYPDSGRVNRVARELLEENSRRNAENRLDRK